MRILIRAQVNEGILKLIKKKDEEEKVVLKCVEKAAKKFAGVEKVFRKVKWWANCDAVLAAGLPLPKRTLCTTKTEGTSSSSYNSRNCGRELSKVSISPNINNIVWSDEDEVNGLDLIERQGYHEI